MNEYGLFPNKYKVSITFHRYFILYTIISETEFILYSQFLNLKNFPFENKTFKIKNASKYEMSLLPFFFASGRIESKIYISIFI